MAVIEYNSRYIVNYYIASSVGKKLICVNHHTIGVYPSLIKSAMIAPT